MAAADSADLAAPSCCAPPQDLKFAWRCVKHVKSNAITVAVNGKLLGMGSGQPNRVKSTQIALEKAAEEVGGGGG